jgi:hypothetical protein
LLPDFTGEREKQDGLRWLTFCTGLRRELECGETEKYFPRVHACVPLETASSHVFIDAFAEIKYCQGNRVIRTTEDLESLRYCDHIRGGLTIEVDDASADFYAMNDIDTIEGQPVFMLPHQVLFAFSGALVVRGSSMTSLSCFLHLVSVMAETQLHEVNSKAYGVAIYGLMMCTRMLFFIS